VTDPNGWPDPQRPGVPLNPERGGWHWLRDDERRVTEQVFIARWNFDAWAQRWYWETGSLVRAEYAGKEWHYIGPCLTPAEVAALVAQSRAEGYAKADEMFARDTRSIEEIKADARRDALREAAGIVRAEMPHITEGSSLISQGRALGIAAVEAAILASAEPKP
jgi:hypothetical protein